VTNEQSSGEQSKYTILIVKWRRADRAITQEFRQNEAKFVKEIKWENSDSGVWLVIESAAGTERSIWQNKAKLLHDSFPH
jgi:hypothetical protein